ncbi:MAG: hypothetical protein Q9199_000643 [Rusavskia elegans]
MTQFIYLDHPNGIASAVLPTLTTKASTIVVAILLSDKDANASLNEEEFLWIKCHAKVLLSKIHQQYQIKRGDNKTPWILKHNGKPISLDSTVGDVNTYSNNVVVFEAVDTPHSTPAPPQLHTPSGGTPLSPKDPNPRARHTPLLPKAASFGHDENSRPPSYPPGVSPTFNTISRASPRPNGGTQHHTHYDLANPPRHTPPGPLYASTDPFSRPPSHTPQPHPSASPAPQSPLVQVPQGNFPVYRDASIAYYRQYFGGESDELLDRRLWTSWLGIPETERARYCPQKSSDPVKTEAPAPQRSARVKAEASASATPQPRHAPISNPQHPSSTVTTTDDYGHKHFQLATMFKDATPQVLESAVEASVKLLGSLRAPLADKIENSPDAEHWIQQIENLSKLAVKTKTVIGVVGNTGAGKSSVINAMLEEERLVPTNCMRACTAVVTEISYNYQDQLYGAEIEFITAEEWAKELKVLFKDLLDSNGNVSSDCTNEDSDAGVTYANIKAVYPQKTREDIARSSISRLLQEVSSITGCRRDIKETDSLMFYKKLQSFVDSKEKSTGKKDKDRKKPKIEREL